MEIPKGKERISRGSGGGGLQPKSPLWGGGGGGVWISIFWNNTFQLLEITCFLSFFVYCVSFLQDFCPEKYKGLCKIMCNKFIKTGDASGMLEPYLSVITKGSCPNDEDGLFLVKDFDPRLSYVASPISGKHSQCAWIYSISQWVVVCCCFFFLINSCMFFMHEINASEDIV